MEEVADGDGARHPVAAPAGGAGGGVTTASDDRPSGGVITAIPSDATAAPSGAAGLREAIPAEPDAPVDTGVPEDSVPEPAAGPVAIGSLTGPWLTIAGVGLGLVVAAGLVLRFWTRSAMWLDEALTVDIARQPLHTLPSYLRRDGAPPLYYVLLHFWMKPFGGSNAALRALSGLLSVATLPIAWVAARRFGGRGVAWVLLALLASAPFAIYYATEVRMYSLVMFLTACGMVALQRSLHQPRPGNLLAVALVTAALFYSQYWALYLVGAIVLLLAWRAWRAWGGRADDRGPALWTLGAVAVGCVAFLPWVPIFAYQSAHTGTPWSSPPNYSAVINAVTGFTNNQATLSLVGSNQGRLLALFYFALGSLALFGVARDRWHVEIDLRTRPPARGVTFVIVVTLAAAITGGIITRSAFSPRYASVVFVPLLILVAYGSRTMAAPRLRAAVVAVMVIAGLAAGVQNVWTQRTQAPQVAAVIAAHGSPGDIVAICPDQLGPSVYRLTPANRYRMITYPRGTGPAFVDWVDYKAVAAKSDPQAFANRLAQMAGGTHRIWLVSSPNFQGFTLKCAQLQGFLGAQPGYTNRPWVSTDNYDYYEPMQLNEFEPPALAHPGGSVAAGP